MVSIELVGKTQSIVGAGRMKSSQDLAECRMDSFGILALILWNTLRTKRKVEN